MPLFTCQHLYLLFSRLHTHTQTNTDARSIVLRCQGAPLSWGSSTSCCSGLGAPKGRDRLFVSAPFVVTNSVVSTVFLNTSAAWKLLRSRMAKSSANGHLSSPMVSEPLIRKRMLLQTEVFFASRCRTQRRCSCVRTWQEPSFVKRRRASASVQRAATSTT